MPERVTLKHVASQAGVSYQTVSKVLNRQIQVSKSTEERIWAAARALGYHPNLIARSLRSQRSNLIGYSWETTPPGLANPILDHFLQSMVQAAESAGYHVMAFPHRPGNEWTEAYRHLIQTKRVDGFVLSSVEYNDPRITLLLEEGFPFVAFGRSNADWAFPYVDIDGAAGMRAVVEHLIDLGHRKIAVLAWPTESRVGNNRMDGIEAGIHAAGLSLRSGWIARGEGSFDFGFEATSAWMKWPQNERPTAIVALNDVMAIGAMHAVQQNGLKVGMDVAVTGFDDMPLIQFMMPALTSVRQPVWEVGQRVINMLLAAMEGNTLEEKNILLPPRLIIRDSTGCRP